MFTGYDDDTFRDLALSADFDLASAMRSGKLPMGDFYSENEVGHLQFDMGAVDFMPMSKSGRKGPEHDRCPDEQTQFFFGDVPPAWPVDPDFRLEGTTVTVENASPEQIGNGLLNLFRQEAAASITKVNRIKFSVKAYVHVGGLSCDVKVRIYRKEFGFAVKFQRRSGDALAFQSLFRLASDHLNSYSCAASSERHALIDAHRSTVTQVPAVGHVGSSKQEFSIAPLLEMSSSSSDLSVQAEVAEALADCARNENLSWQLSTPDALRVRENIAGIHHISVAHPMRRLQAALAHVAQSYASPFVEGADKCIFPAMGALEPPLMPRVRL
jgi:hypothetical protein